MADEQLCFFCGETNHPTEHHRCRLCRGHLRRDGGRWHNGTCNNTRESMAVLRAVIEASPVSERGLGECTDHVRDCDLSGRDMPVCLYTQPVPRDRETPLETTRRHLLEMIDSVISLLAPPVVAPVAVPVVVAPVAVPAVVVPVAVPAVVVPAVVVPAVVVDDDDYPFPFDLFDNDIDEPVVVVPVVAEPVVMERPDDDNHDEAKQPIDQQPAHSIMCTVCWETDQHNAFGHICNDCGYPLHNGNCADLGNVRDALDALHQQLGDPVQRSQICISDDAIRSAITYFQRRLAPHIDFGRVLAMVGNCSIAEIIRAMLDVIELAERRRVIGELSSIAWARNAPSMLDIIGHRGNAERVQARTTRVAEPLGQLPPYRAQPDPRGLGRNGLLQSPGLPQGLGIGSHGMGHGDMDDASPSLGEMLLFLSTHGYGGARVVGQREHASAPANKVVKCPNCREIGRALPIRCVDDRPKEENGKAKECMICYENPVDTVMGGCGDMVVCMRCAEKMDSA